MSKDAGAEFDIPGTDVTPGAAEPRPWWRRHLKAIVLAIIVALLIWYPIGMLWVQHIDDDPSFAPSDADMASNGSRAVTMAAMLIDREVNQHRWVASDPFFLPGSALDNMPNFQQGIMASLGRFAFEMTDQLGRARGSSRADPDLQKAAGLLQYPGDRWLLNFSNSLLPGASSVSQYRDARNALIAYNRRVAEGSASFERRSDNLQAAIDRIAADLGSASAVIDQHVSENSHQWIDWHSDDVFYSVKGQSYAYYLLLRELGRDYEAVLKEKELSNVWQNMLVSLRDAATIRPWIVSNGSPDGQFLPNHLAVQGFYLLRARTQLREVSQILQK
ncbi:MAG TPA: DUF2333 family protein [Candidatus Cybelea sp.]|nr:DUF2333 family protein [Candidatus Cybelea sp.]